MFPKCFKNGKPPLSRRLLGSFLALPAGLGVLDRLVRPGQELFHEGILHLLVRTDHGVLHLLIGADDTVLDGLLGIHDRVFDLLAHSSVLLSYFSPTNMGISISSITMPTMPMAMPSTSCCHTSTKHIPTPSTRALTVP